MFSGNLLFLFKLINMKFKDYCLVIMGDKENVYSDIIKISESRPNYLNAKGIAIITFTSIMDVEEITELFKSSEKNFLLFNLNKSNSGFNFIKPEIHEGLFGFINKDRDEFLTEKSKLLQQEIEFTSGSTTSKINEPQLSIDDIPKLTLEEKDFWINSIMDKGVNNLSDYDKKLLDNLSSD